MSVQLYQFCQKQTEAAFDGRPFCGDYGFSSVTEDRKVSVDSSLPLSALMSEVSPVLAE